MDPVLVAADAGLTYTPCDGPGISRRRRGTGFTYLGPRGGTVDTGTKRWIDSIAIPPAWTEVWISPDRDAHVLARGCDDAGRMQYRYHPEFRRVADEVKYARLGHVAPRIPHLRTAVADACVSDDERVRTVGLVAHLIDLTLLRVGTERYADENESYGACTLRRRHVSVDDGAGDDTVRFDFRAKGGQRRRFELHDPLIAQHVRAGTGRPGRLLMSTASGWHPTGDDVAYFLTDAAGVEMTAKDLRTWGATACMTEALCTGASDPTSRDALLLAFDAVAERLGNTRAVARASYVAPVVVECWENGSLAEDWARSRSSPRCSRAERATTRALSRATLTPRA